MVDRPAERLVTRRHVNILLVVLGAAIVLVGTIFGVLKVYELSSGAHHAICALRAERVRGIQDGKRFLREHPHGIPGISASDIQQSIDAQKQTVRAFRFADC